MTFTSNVQLEVDTGVIAYLSRYEDNVKTGYDFRLDKFVNKKMISSLQAAMIQYDTLSEEPNHWIIKNYTERDLKGMREVITSGGRIDSIINMQPQDLLIQKGQQQTLTNPQLAQYIERQKQRGFANIQAFEVEYYQRGASSFAAFILTAIGLSLSAKKRKNGMGISLGIGLLLSFTGCSRPSRPHLLFKQTSRQCWLYGSQILCLCLLLSIVTNLRQNDDTYNRHRKHQH